MTVPNANYAGYSEATAIVFTWLADKVLGGFKKAFDWGWERAQWDAAQDRYDAQIIKQYGEIRIFAQTIPKPLRDIFTDVFVLDEPTARRRFDPQALRRHLWEEERSLAFRNAERQPGQQVLNRGTKFFILGRPGAGKTTFLKRLAVGEAQRGKWGPCLGKVPIFVPLKQYAQYAEAGKSLFDFIVHQFAVCQFPDAAPFVERLLKSGRALVLFDGLDEVMRSADVRSDRRGQVAILLEEFADQYADCHVVVTCRIAATEYAFAPGFVYLELADFVPEQVAAFVRNWFWDAKDQEASSGCAERMLAEWALPEHASIRDLTRNPLLLTLLCLDYAETGKLTDRRVELYESALKALLKKWDASRGIERYSVYKELSPGRREHMFARIAFDAFAQDEILFTQSDLEARLRSYLANVPGMPDPLDLDTEAVLYEIVEKHGIFTEQSQGLFSFAHLTFQEYYAAKHIVESGDPVTLEGWRVRVLDRKWREVFLSAADLLPDATAFLRALEQELNRLVARFPGACRWLRRVERHANVSVAGFRQPVVRLCCVDKLVRDFERDVNLAGNYDVRLAFDRGLYDDFTVASKDGVDPVHNLRDRLDCVLTKDPGRGIDLAVLELDRLAFKAQEAFAHKNRGAAFGFSSDWARVILYSVAPARFKALSIALSLDRHLACAIDLQQLLAVVRLLIVKPVLATAETRDLLTAELSRLSQVEKTSPWGEALHKLTIPPDVASSAAWEEFLCELQRIIDAHGVLEGYHRLQAELDAFCEVEANEPSLDRENLLGLVAYLEGCELFYNCLRLSVTPERRAFEDRILALPGADC